MFTGIIEEIGVIRQIISNGSIIKIIIEAKEILIDLQINHSVSVNGVCLTVIERGTDFFLVDAVTETLARTTLLELKKNDYVNLERALRLQDRLGGHLVQGHVDDVGTIRQFDRRKEQNTLAVEIPNKLQKYVISKGSIAIDGVSLTIAEKRANIITVSVIPHTMRNTAFPYKKIGDRVNIEVDFIAKYIEQFTMSSGKTEITNDWLKQQGYYV